MQRTAWMSFNKAAAEQILPYQVEDQQAKAAEVDRGASQTAGTPGEPKNYQQLPSFFFSTFVLPLLSMVQWFGI